MFSCSALRGGVRGRTGVGLKRKGVAFQGLSDSGRTPPTGHRVPGRWSILPERRSRGSLGGGFSLDATCPRRVSRRRERRSHNGGSGRKKRQQGLEHTPQWRHAAKLVEVFSSSVSIRGVQYSNS